MPGVAQACLELQDRFELDVPLFLALLHGAGRGYRIDSETIRALDKACGKWRAEVVRPPARGEGAAKGQPLEGKP
ncbi:TIGR02444 family protein (plasmid) [Sinorhizobium meliloti]|nr:TIGR02444 family protein [Sinorhizobium meliloti]WKL39665.1 TIGR02444 family protein [Sinorhizobium meliloti]